MKRNLFTAVVAAILLLLSACDTTDTTTIRINLGGSRAGAPPDTISAVYIGCFDRYTGVLYSAIGTVPTGSVSMVVPAKTDLYFLLMAQDTENNSLYVGEVVYPGAYMLIEPVDVTEGVVTISPQEIPIDNITESYSLGLEYSDGGLMLNQNDGGVYNFFQPEMLYPPYFERSSLLEMHFGRGSSYGSYNTIYRQNYALFFDLYEGMYEDIYPDGIPNGSSIYYRSRVYIPVFGLYLFNAGEDAIFTD